MPFVPFRDHFRDLAERETRTVTVFEGTDRGLPAGDYAFIELFCDEPGCDCRRVFLWVHSSIRQRPEAVIAYGWESREFYAAWMRDDDAEVLATLQGPVLNAFSPQSELAPAILELAKDVLLNDAHYVTRVKRHYQMFRERIEQHGRGARRESIGRNEPCRCGSGRKFKKCCGREGAAVDRGAACGEIRILGPDEPDIVREIEHIVGLAAQGQGRLVSIGQLVLFATATGDAWLLDGPDGLALPLARAGDPLDFNVRDTPRRFGIEWKGSFRIEGDRFVYASTDGSVRIIEGYPTDQIQVAVSRFSAPRRAH
jgi:hypothetical protein